MYRVPEYRAGSRGFRLVTVNTRRDSRNFSDGFPRVRAISPWHTVAKLTHPCRAQLPADSAYNVDARLAVAVIVV